MAEKKEKKTDRGGLRPPRTTRAAKPAAPKAVAKKPAAPKTKTPVRRAVARPVTRAARPARPERVEAEAAPAPKPKAEPRPLPTAPAGEAPVIAADGTVSGTLALPEALVAIKRRAGVLFQTLLASASNAHLGTAATKNRSRVRGGGAKPWRQKGTGRARQGSTRAPHWRHGGVVFGPNGRRYRQIARRKMRREAFAEAFAARAGEGRILVYDAITFEDDAPRTRALVEWLDKIGDTGRVLFVTGEVDERTARSAENAPRTSVRTVGALRTSELFTHDTVIVHRGALDLLARRAALSASATAKDATA